MTDTEIIQLWRAGLSKNKLAVRYKREHNQQVKIIRASIKHRHDGKFMTEYEALAKVEMVICRYLQRR